jgi:hypothetical protein
MARQWELDTTISVQRDSTAAHGQAAALSPGTWEQIVHLQHLLATQDLDALDWTRKLEPVLTAQLGAASLASLQRHMADLDFASASALLARVAPPSAAPERGGLSCRPNDPQPAAPTSPLHADRALSAGPSAQSTVSAPLESAECYKNRSN